MYICCHLVYCHVSMKVYGSGGTVMISWSHGTIGGRSIWATTRTKFQRQVVVEGSNSCSNEVVVDKKCILILLGTVLNQSQAHRECGGSSTHL